MDDGCWWFLHVQSSAGRGGFPDRRRLVLAVQAVRRLFQYASRDHQRLRTVERQPQSYSGTVDHIAVGTQSSKYLLCGSRGDRLRLAAVSRNTADIRLDGCGQVLSESMPMPDRCRAGAEDCPAGCRIEAGNLLPLRPAVLLQSGSAWFNRGYRV